MKFVNLYTPSIIITANKFSFNQSVLDLKKGDKLIPDGYKNSKFDY